MSSLSQKVVEMEGCMYGDVQQGRDAEMERVWEGL